MARERTHTLSGVRSEETAAKNVEVDSLTAHPVCKPYSESPTRGQRVLPIGHIGRPSASIRFRPTHGSSAQVRRRRARLKGAQKSGNRPDRLPSRHERREHRRARGTACNADLRQPGGATEIQVLDFYLHTVRLGK